MSRVELTRFMNGARVVQIVDYATYVQWTAHNIFSFSARFV